MINRAARLIATFKTIDPDSGTASYFDYGLLRYPGLHAVLKNCCDVKPATIIEPNSLEPGLAENLLKYRILVPQIAQPDQPLLMAPGIEAYLTAFVRFADAPSRREMLLIRERPEAIKWTLAEFANPAANQQFPLQEADRQYLAEKGLWVAQQAPAAAYYPVLSEFIDQDLPVRTGAPRAAEILATAEQVYVQRAGEQLPKPVLNLLGSQVPELPNAHIAWGCDVGTRLPQAAVVDEDEIAILVTEKEQRARLPEVAARKQFCNNHLAAAKAVYKRNAYTQLSEVIAPNNQQALRLHMRDMASKNYFGKMGDGQVDKRMAIHNEPATASLHHRIAKLVSSIVGEKLVPTYAYLAMYVGGAVLERHIDRGQCRYNMSVVFDMCDAQGNDIPPWPIYLQVKNKTKAVNMKIGDGVIYRGNQLEHWREALPDNHIATICFYHFVDQNFKGTMV